MSDLNEFTAQLRAGLQGDVFDGIFDRGRYATDASVYQMMPRAVATPASIDDVHAAIEIAREHQVPVLPRGGGTSQCGQTVNRALVLDNSRHLNQVLELDVEARRCVVQPGIVLDELNRQLKPHGLWFPVDVSTSSRATIGGMAANNSCGQRSICYGTMRDNVYSIDAITPDGQSQHFGVFDKQNALAAGQAALIEPLMALGQREADEIRARFPDVLRRVGGYNLDALLPDRGANNLAHLLVGSEGTLAYSTAIELKLSPLPVNKVLGVCHFPTFYRAMDAAQHLVKLNPRAVELVDSTMISLARDIELFKPMVEQFVRGDPAAVLIVEFAFDEQDENLRHLQLLDQMMGDLGYSWSGDDERWGGVVEAADAALQGAIAEVRKAGLNIMMSMKSEGKPVSFVEDCAVALPDLAEYTSKLTEVFERHGTTGTWYAHASVGCLHVRPVLNLKLESDANTMREIADEAFDLVLRYKGSHSGEHGDGISRSEFHEKMFGSRMVESFAVVKRTFDPDNLFNPGKIVNAPRMNDRTLLRYPPGYSMQGIVNRLDWSGYGGAGGGLQGAVEMCNNNGACRKLQGGAMCPSYRVTRNERDVTRGRANTLRLALSGQLGDDALLGDEMAETLKLCVSCKACKRECPTGVDMAKMKLEVLAARVASNGVTLHDRLIAMLPVFAPWLARFSALINPLSKISFIRLLLEKVAGFARSRALPVWRRDWFSETESIGSGDREVVLLSDTFNTWFEPDNLRAARHVLSATGYRVHIATSGDSKRLCCGRTCLAAGLVDDAREQAMRLQKVLWPWVERGVPIVGLEPSCLLTLRDEHLSLLPGDETQRVADNSFLLEEFLQRETDNGRFDNAFEPLDKRVLLHGHCHQKAFDLMGSVKSVLSSVPGLQVEMIESSCCGMAGAFGYAADTAEVSRQMAALDLLPAVAAADADTLIVADGTSCRHQIEELGERRVYHVAQILEMALPASS
jgi:FAD/FMN-containing dehydrogenase/Fe-S oxidoreductase